MKIIKYILKVLGVLIILFAIFIIYSSISDYKPLASELIYSSNSPDTIYTHKELSIMIWNIGYCGLSDDMDFFYDGGKQVRSARQIVEKNISAIEKFLAQQGDIDFFLLLRTYITPLLRQQPF